MEALKSTQYRYSIPGKETQIGKPLSGVARVSFRGENRLPSLRIVKARSLSLSCNSSVNDDGFEEKGHLEYYYGEKDKRKGKKSNKAWNEVSAKKRMKLLKGLVGDLMEFSELGFGLGLDCVDSDGLVGDDKKTRISQAAEVLLAQLKQLKAEEEKMKKQEKKKTKSQDCESSSSSSSESSSDSECDEVVDMTRLRGKTITQPIETKETHCPPSLEQQDCCNMILETALNENASIEVLNLETPVLNPSDNVVSKKIEVCMGGKCKKSGAPALMDEFRRAVGDEGAVVGCKCMGKCKSAPNVRVVNSEDVGGDSLSIPGNSLCVGVGLEDVGLIVANYFGDEKKGLGLAVAAFPSC